jgi:hypothetical protein
VVVFLASPFGAYQPLRERSIERSGGRCLAVLEAGRLYTFYCLIEIREWLFRATAVWRYKAGEALQRVEEQEDGKAGDCGKEQEK